MLWALRATRLGCIISPCLAPILRPPTVTDLLINPQQVDADVSTFFHEAVELESAHSLDDDLDDLDDIHVMPNSLPSPPLHWHPLWHALPSACAL